MNTKTAPSALEVIDQIEREAQGHDADLRMARTLQPGQFVRQGDVYLVALPHVPNGDWKDKRWADVKRTMQPEGRDLWTPWKRCAESGVKPRGSRQLALGSTQGSRHIASEGPTIYDFASSDECVGPVVDATERWNLTHPEHAHESVPSGCVGTIYQLDVQTQQRVQD
jgi:hypothetical protein